MKLLFCNHCEDVIRLILAERKCECGRTKGKYLDDVNAVYSGDDAIPIGFDNYSLNAAIKEQPIQSTKGKRFVAFVIPVRCDTFRKVHSIDADIIP